MAKISDITVNIGVAVPDETLQRCLDIITIWLADHPDMTIGVETFKNYADGTTRRVCSVEEIINKEA